MGDAEQPHGREYKGSGESVGSADRVCGDYLPVVDASIGVQVRFWRRVAERDGVEIVGLRRNILVR